MKHREAYRVAGDKSEIVAAIPAACSDERSAVEFIERQRWGNRPTCPRCGATGVVQMKGRDGQRSARYLWDCRSCRRQFTVRIGTVLEDSRIPLRHWCYAFWAACASKKGVSALQIKRQTGLSYKSALYLMHRIRYAMKDASSTPLQGVVEVDETYVGGRPRRPQWKAADQYEHKDERRARIGRGAPVPPKQPVVALVERGGSVRAQVVTSVTAPTLRKAIRQHVAPSAAIHTDENRAYKGVGREQRGGHGTVRHGIRQYVDGDVHINSAESFFALLKRGLIGTFHAVSKKHLHRYVDEFAFRWNHRKIEDGARTVAAIRGAVGKRLYYRQPVTQSV